MAGKTPLLDQLKSDKRKTDDILLPLVEKWLIEHGDGLDKYSEDDWKTLRDLMVRGALRNPKVFSPSGATACRRRQVIDKNKKFKQIPISDPKLRRIFDDGKWRHLRWQMVFYKMGIVESMETFTSLGELDYGGSYDVIVNLKLKLNKKIQRVLIDIKGTNASRFNEIRLTHRPILGNKVQLIIYMYLNDIDIGLLWYENKNTQDICEIVVRRDKFFYRILKQYIIRQKYMRKYVKRGAFPKEECDVDERDTQFRQCSQRNNCRCLPVHLIQNGELLKIQEPRRINEQKEFVQHNKMKRTKVRGEKGARSIPLKK